ncbi:right-handed parallel beta-helix repeat-containing protein [Gemmata sp. JC717]|uniref:right-handed parallel beta-helix repeat-containing protein n=1 Tax=Gemmata algarum TaxID=2975278 RepID=UPI0021BAD702|nr:right-handed parallel beta-helix repeat-containing protein [Gemmata algarum]MDY3555274.1 right-handed parallel beta-helix repeat-containing protein [Gemmata algarum]
MSRRVTALFASGLALSFLAFLAIGFAGRGQPVPRPEPFGPFKVPHGTVRDHGAKGDGCTDDWQAVQNAVNAGNGPTVFPHGTYRISKPVLVNLNKAGFAALRGDGTARIVMAGEGPAFKFVGTHTGTADPKTVGAQVWNERMPSVEGLEIVGEHDKANGIEAAGTMQLTVSKVLIRKCFHGIHLTARNRNVLVSDCHIYENRGVGVYLDNVNLHQINVTGSHISYCDLGGVVARAGQVRNLHITGCDIESNHGANGPPTANVLIDSTGGSNAEVAITGCTVQHNHNAPGSANIRIKGPSVTKANGTDELRDGHVTITGNVLSDVKVNVHLDHARGVVMTGNTCWTAYEHNVLVENCAAVTIGPNNFDRNPRYASEERPETANDLVFRNSTDCVLTGFTVSRVRAAPAAVTLDTCDRFNVTNVTILDSDAVGLLLKDVSRSRVSGCLIRDDRPRTKSLAVKAGGGRANMIVDNYFGRPSEIPTGVGLVERNYDGNKP